MLYVNAKDIDTIGIDWKETVAIVEEAVTRLHAEDFHQPIKPYLLFKNDPSNRIIAMPAYVGGKTSMAGIKWIASFPKNIQQGIPRANSVTILNDLETGMPLSIINTAVISGIRTASVSGLMIKKYDEIRPLPQGLTVGIIGFGPIGQLHLSMVAALLGERVSTYYIYDLNGVNKDKIPQEIADKVVTCSSWEEVYDNRDIFITCTVSSKGYIDKKPKAGSLLLNVSLRDFAPDILAYTKAIVVDDWDEVCRANTDIEHMHNERGLQKADTISIADVVCTDLMQTFNPEDAILFNPMGMAIFDIAMGTHYYRQALEKGIGVELE